VKQAREFGTTWQGELVRYVIHGLLHLCGHDDLMSAARSKMKREENRLLRETTKRFVLAKLETRNPKRGNGNSAFRAPRSAI
jgi:ssRNA-specific RNase YbeY (16S rRNA maturation enzyme)